MINCQYIIDNYLKWIKDNTSIKSIEEGKSCEIITPFLDRHNDHLQIYILKNDNEYKLTDGGETISDLKNYGMEINTPKRKKILEIALNGFGVQIGENDEIFTNANINNIGQKKHYLLQAILTVNDMYNLSSENVYSFFKEDVERYFQSKDIIHTVDHKLMGKSGITHNFDFIIPPRKHHPEKLIKTINNPNKNNVELVLFHFDDVSKVRQQETSNYVIYNDLNKTPSSDILSALSNYGVTNIPWTQREKCKEEFAIM